MADPIHLALIDDDAAVLDWLRLYFARNRVRATCFQAAGVFLGEMHRCGSLDCVVTDVRIPGMSRLDLVLTFDPRRLDPPDHSDYRPWPHGDGRFGREVRRFRFHGDLNIGPTAGINP